MCKRKRLLQKIKLAQTIIKYKYDTDIQDFLPSYNAEIGFLITKKIYIFIKHEIIYFKIRVLINISLKVCIVEFQILYLTLYAFNK